MSKPFPSPVLAMMEQSPDMGVFRVLCQVIINCASSIPESKRSGTAAAVRKFAHANGTIRAYPNLITEVERALAA